jgi:hypothetical protein
VAAVAAHPGGFTGVEAGVTGRRGLVAVELEDREGGRESHLDHSSAVRCAGLSAALLVVRREGAPAGSTELVPEWVPPAGPIGRPGRIGKPILL